MVVVRPMTKSVEQRVNIGKTVPVVSAHGSISRVVTVRSHLDGRCVSADRMVTGDCLWDTFMNNES
jgi:hypothetical protein